ncbi:piriformospora indica-insensitive protein 2-like [Punica granatum]|uniref:Disease resistance R13L4/SHOC-2-like LRR domain-containing protein n=2 Tax=Punica granatum TaxID=22663 RepID=A0A218VY10_PUNGR|nr:piriformospora indica-insensitive protein 2-like [Punica granatum]OWM65169.1 hypothetical protein CDL15_Pgr008756 [Punica granatum]PKI43904.1 hypothetical protein CRG98_035738 [Punica granatum]
MERAQIPAIGAQPMLPFIFFFFFFFFVIGSLSGSCLGQHTEDESNSSAMEVTAPMDSRQREALYSAIQGFVGKWWNGSDLYPDPCGWTPIEGVSCEVYDGLWYVSRLSVGPIYENSLRCTRNPTFTSHLFDLRRLTALSFYKCFSSSPHGAVTISDLPWERLSRNLESLEFRLNQGLTGAIPASLSHLRQLRSLIVLENGFAGELPAEIGNLKSLKRLVLSGNRFTGRIPSGFGGLTNLLIVDFSRNGLSGSIPLTFGGLTSLLKLDLSGNNLQGFLPDEIGNLKNLTLMDLGRNNLSGGLRSPIQEMGSLRVLMLSNNPKFGGDLTGVNWSNLRSLEVLDLTNTGLTGPIPESISDLNGLRHLGLGCNSLSGTPPAKLSSMPRLSSLYLNRNNLSGKLMFPKSFYRRTRWRFRAEDNPGLCHEAEVAIPFGVKQCLLEFSGRTEVVGKMRSEEEDFYRKPQLEVSTGYRNFDVGLVAREVLVVVATVLIIC